MQVPLISGYLLSLEVQNAIKKFTGEVYNKASETSPAASTPASSSKVKPKVDANATLSLVSDMFT